MHEIDSRIDELKAATGEDEAAAASKAAAGTLEGVRKEMLGESTSVAEAIQTFMEARVPRFFYFAEYSALPGTVKIQDLLKGKREDLDDGMLTARALLQQAGADGEYLLNPDYETRKRELENVANSISVDVLEFWTTNPELRVLIDITQRTEDAKGGQKTVLEELKIRLWDDRHMLSLPFDERSSGFRWFFSFLAAFSEYENSEIPIIILLDEPGLGLHARAQKDFLNFIEKRLAPKCQVVYSTHSPFMVQPNHLERVRLVEDKGREIGSKVSADVLATDADTLFPLQGALGYDMAQHLFIAPYNLVVEGTSDFTYLTIISDWLSEQGRNALDPRWSIVPVGSADSVPTFVALLGHHLNVTVLIDSRKQGHQRLDGMVAQGLLQKNGLITIGDVLGRNSADIEDLFEVDEYLSLFNAAFKTTVTSGELAGSDPIVNRLARTLGRDRYDHGRPADVLLRNKLTILPTFSAATLKRFEQLFDRINATLPPKT